MFAFVATVVDESRDNQWFQLTCCVCCCVLVSLNLLYMIIYSLCKVKGYSFDENASTVPPSAHSILCTWTYSAFAYLLLLLFTLAEFPVKVIRTMKGIFVGCIPCLGPRMSKLHFINICFDIDEAWCVSYHGSDEPWAPPGSNCLHHRSDCKLTSSAGHQLARRLQQNGQVAEDDGVIRYLCLLLCLLQARGTASAVCFVTKDGN